jgi:arginyl-tRNA synthetase
VDDRLRRRIEQRLSELGWPAPPEIVVERPRDPAHGDWSTSVALALAKSLRRPPRVVAEEFAAGWNPDPDLVAEVSVAGPGFVNFRLRPDFLNRSLRAILRGPDAYLRSDDGRGRPVNVEFVSSNPTGPLHIGHGRNAALGDAIANLLETTGWQVTREYYFNDAGRQMETLGRSLLARYVQLSDPSFPLPEDGYEGDYLIPIAEGLRERHGDTLYDPSVPDTAVAVMQRHATEVMIDSIREDLELFGVRFDTWFNESTLYQEGRLEAALEELRSRGAVYEREGAVWFRASAFGDTEDRVLIKSSGQPTYFLPDIAYHLDKRARGFQRAVDVLGADHHGYVPRMQAALAALGFEPGWLQCIVYQAVTLIEGGEAVKLSTRKARFVTLRELIEEVGPDVARYFFVMRRADTHLNFDLDVARSQSEENPVYYIQYAHARVASVFERLREAGGKLARLAETAPIGSPDDLHAGLSDPPPTTVVPGEPLDVEHLEEAPLERLEHARETELLRILADFPALVRGAAEASEPHRVAALLERLAKEFHAWYHDVRILGQDAEVARARLALARGVQIAIRRGLGLLGIRAPDSM